MVSCECCVLRLAKAKRKTSRKVDLYTIHVLLHQFLQVFSILANIWEGELDKMLFYNSYCSSQLIFALRIDC